MEVGDRPGPSGRGVAGETEGGLAELEEPSYLRYVGGTQQEDLMLRTTVAR